MPELILRKTQTGIFPVDAANQEVFDSLPLGECKASITYPRNLGFHRKFFALLKAGFDAWDCPGVEYKGQHIEKNFDRFRKDVTILAGYGHPVVNVKGEVRYEAESISFSNMSEETFEKLYSRVIDVLLQRILKHYNRDDLERVVENLLRFG